MYSENLIKNEDLRTISNSQKDYYIYLEAPNFQKPTEIETESRNGVDVTIFTTILQEAELPNRNGRIYTKKAIDEALNRTMIKEKLQHKKWFGENKHPVEQTVKRQTRIEPANISHIVTDYWWKENLLYGRVETANTSAGKDFQGLIRQGCESSFSMRGLGGDTKTRDGYDYIDSGLFIMCYDSVDFPSHEKAYQDKILREDTNLFNTSLLNEDVRCILNEAKIFKVNQEELKDLLKSNIIKTKFLPEDKMIVDSYLASL